MRFKSRVIFLLLFLGFNYFSSAQSRIDTLLSLYGKKNAAPTLFVHYDKNIYTNNETIWFTAYLLNTPKTETDTARSIFSVVLIRNIDTALIMEEKFAMQNGLSFGSIDLPNVLSTGDYRLIAYTNNFMNGRPVADFTQEITIKTTSVQPINLSLKTLNDKGNTAKILLSASTKFNSLFKRPVTISYNYGNSRKIAQTDKSSQLLINLPLKSQITDPRLNIKAKIDKDSSFISTVLKMKPRKASVRFYPEGGNLVNGIPARVAFEVNDQYGSSLEVRGQLYQDNKQLDDIALTSYGIGRFTFMPKEGSSYYIKLIHPELSDSLYALPAATTHGVVIAMPDAVTADTLKFTLISNTPQLLYLRLHNFNNTLAYAAITVNGSKNVTIPLYDMPKGLATLTILDSLERPLAERMCFLHYGSKEMLSIATDSIQYGKRQKVTLNLKTDSINSALVSIACVQNNRIDLRKANEISQYYYLERELGNTPVPPFGKNLKDKDYIENVLLVKGWRRYKWEAVLNTKPADTLQKTAYLTIKGTVLRNSKPVKAPVFVTLVRNPGVSVLTTDSTGGFYPAIEDMEIRNNKKLGIFLTTSSSLASFSYKITDEFSTFNKTIGGFYPLKDYDGASNLQDNTQFVIKSDEKALTIKEVEINNKTDDGLYGANICGDYVCPYHILNCRNHNSFTPGTTKPVVGKSYLTWMGNITEPHYYEGCEELYNNVVQINPKISIAKEFYIDNYTNTAEPAFFSTLLWQHAVVLKAGETTKLTFYTGDIKGKFRVIVQGTAGNDVISGDTAFEVK